MYQNHGEISFKEKKKKEEFPYTKPRFCNKENWDGIYPLITDHLFYDLGPLSLYMLIMSIHR